MSYFLSKREDFGIHESRSGGGLRQRARVCVHIVCVALFRIQ